MLFDGHDPWEIQKEFGGFKIRSLISVEEISIVLCGKRKTTFLEPVWPETKMNMKRAVKHSRCANLYLQTICKICILKYKAR